MSLAVWTYRNVYTRRGVQYSPVGMLPGDGRFRYAWHRTVETHWLTFLTSFRSQSGGELWWRGHLFLSPLLLRRCGRFCLNWFEVVRKRCAIKARMGWIHWLTIHTCERGKTSYTMQQISKNDDKFAANGGNITWIKTRNYIAKINYILNS